jgi:hypothetical protein
MTKEVNMVNKTETRVVDHFTSIELRGAGEINIKQNSDPNQTETLVIEADEDVLPKLTSIVKEGKLILGWDYEWWDILGWINLIFTPKRATYHVTMNQVNGIAIQGSGSVNSPSIKTEQCKLLISGSGKMIFDEINCERLIAGVSGSGDYTFNGKVKQFESRISGSGRVRAEQLVTEICSVTISGSGHVAVEVSTSLDVSISGSGSVRYKGQPKITQSISGSGRIQAL